MASVGTEYLFVPPTDREPLLPILLLLKVRRRGPGAGGVGAEAE
jgi:hypothetical protein